MDNEKILKFPDDFFWGTATSAHQIEGENTNNWSEWEQSKRRIIRLEKRGDNPKDFISGKACDSYELYETDLDLASQLNNNAYRFSIEWSRVEPLPGVFDQSEIEHYHKVITACRERRLEPFVTLWHWTEPDWFAARKGWLGEKCVFYFAKFVDKIAQEFAKDVNFWLTLNEPLIYSFDSYWQAKWPPQQRSLTKTWQVIKNLASAHRAAYYFIHKHNYNAQVGIVKNNQYFEPYQNKLLNRWVCKVVNWYWNDLFIKQVIKKLDFIGLNYYFHNLINFKPFDYKNLFVELKNKNEKISDMGWEIYPAGIYHVLKNLAKLGLPIFITENGLADETDTRRAQFIIEHLKYIHQAIEENIDVRGYFHWSLLDNFEWSEGWWPKFGLYAVDRKTFQRSAKPSSQVYAGICKNNSIKVNGQ